jgi:glycosyltransferase involved in cell wall biosynthesis
MAFLKTNVPIVYFSDATFAAMWGYYDDFADLLSISRFEGNHVERRAIRKATRIIYASDWAKMSAIRDYGADPAKIDVIPFGANLEDPPNGSVVLARTREQRLRLLFVGVDWYRKGGPIAIHTLYALKRMGIPANLTVVGCKPPGVVEASDLQIVPFLNQNDPVQSKRLVDLYLNSDVLLLPTRAECSGIAFCEAAAYGLPAFATDTGGVPSVIENGVTGFLLPLQATAEDYAKAIAELWQEPSRLEAVAQASRKAFERKLNWDSWGKSAAKVLRAAVKESALRMMTP